MARRTRIVWKRQGLTLIELLIGVLLLIGGGASLLLGMQYSMAHAEQLSQFQIATNAAQGQLEQLSSVDVDVLWAGVEYQPAVAGVLCRGMGEDANCNGALDLGEDLDVDSQLDELLPGGRFAIQIRSADTRNPLNPNLLDLHVAACWNSRGRLIGEGTPAAPCTEIDGAAYPNAGWEVRSPVMVSTRIGRRD